MTTFPEGEFLLPLFPLPNLVFFPRTRLPLHVFEPRYRKMITDAVAADQFLRDAHRSTEGDMTMFTREKSVEPSATPAAKPIEMSPRARSP